MELRHLKCMLAVAEDGQFNLAAKRLHVAPPALSQSIRQLEAEVGTPLFVRTTRSVTLTDAGRAFYAEALKAVGQIENASRLALRAASGETGQLSIGLTSTTVFGPLRSLLRRFHTLYPNVHIATKEYLGPSMLEDMDRGILDFTFLEECTPNPRYAIRSLKPVDVFVAIPRRHLLAEDSRPLKLKQLRGESLILPAPNRIWNVYEKIYNVLASAGVDPLNCSYADNAITALGLVSAGLGISFVPRYCEMMHAEIAFRKVISPGIQVEPQLIHLRERTSPAMSNFLRLLPGR